MGYNESISKTKEVQNMNLFETERIGALQLSGHLIRSAIPEGKAGKNGEPLPRLAEYYQKLTEQGIAAIICGPISVTGTAQPQPGQLRLHTARQLADYQRLTDAVHDANGLILARLSYPAASQENPGDAHWRLLRSLERSFSHAASRAKEAGFDGIELDFTCYSLPGCFLSLLYNQRKAAYGGDIHARVRFPRDIYRAIRRAVGPDYPVWVCLDADMNRISVQDLLVTGQYFASAGTSAIEVCGDFPPYPPQPDDNTLLPQIHPGEMLSRIIRIPVILTAGLNTTLEMQQVARRSRVHVFGLDHQLEENPDFIEQMIR